MPSSKTAKVFSAELEGIESKLIEVETDINVGLHSFTIVGLADKALSEAKERVNSALKNIGVKPPSKENRRIVVNLAPADFKKTGSHYDLPIAVGYLLATGQMLSENMDDAIFVGELALDGRLRPVNGVLSIAGLAKKLSKTLYVPQENASEASIVSGITVVPIPDLKSLIDHVERRDKIQPHPHTVPSFPESSLDIDISEIKGQEHAKRALIIAASGGHNLLMVGPPGTGKSMLAQALISILPPLSHEEIIETTKIYSAAGLLGGQPFIGRRPFRTPHQSASLPAVVGGGQSPKPGEVSLAHRGILFLDELPEFRRDVLEALRQPIENGRANISRVKGTLSLPAKFTLIAAMNPCPCGYWGDPDTECNCAATDITRYQRRLSGPLLDRIDLQIHVPRVPLEKLRSININPQESHVFKSSVISARKRQSERLKKIHKITNAELSSKECDSMIQLENGVGEFLTKASDKLKLSARAYYRTLKVAQTIADIENSDTVSQAHIAEAFSYKLKEHELGAL
ncbi:MAG: hypothetical protein COU07_03465 [Candidatus Harrisonbacteria bacterium CG10_big_fil_rev_8_21_14_0_10_40_38]|uniref:AAA+ ATPase domain-containing protein n=1 Tax=Candidatus Harrisonbacteria bacterium CG10_big_fil_rev_8_21_14_0_10_40_38 TaxID=1974583 RepID=A0A2H0UR77_9BACT|nr:MAG: hypothetical protein COU07_03465 [Candidatus Harrisonbacteria bacterium CG10_big_fil_rev_8_21_14_0_10_40_38]